MKRGVWGLDRLRVRVRGRDPQRFLNRASRQGIRLSRLRREEDGFSATAPGTARARIEALARQGDWQVTVEARQGPGPWAERVLARPGLAVGAALFLVLLQLFGHLLWTIDFGALTEGEALRLRSLLAECGIHEGAWVEEETLEIARQLALQQSDLFGWISLNFTGGCLFVERTEARYQTLRDEVPLQALYARETGQITAMEAESGFAAVQPGQAVERGQLLVNGVRPDHDGDPVYQGASGRVMARVEKSYTAFQPLQHEAEVLTGGSVTQAALYLPGVTLQDPDAGALPAGTSRVTWDPVQLGRLSLPACIRRETLWPAARQRVSYSRSQARALARRACRAALLAEFPDAVIEEEQCQWQTGEAGEGCTVTYRFCADIAVPGPVQAVPEGQN